MKMLDDLLIEQNRHLPSRNSFVGMPHLNRLKE
ncbi:hypothetical protein ISM_12880 [Roseovarius nubinhibens ISM]|uniref:Uncharacterized protein n=1 Tax=Roseovarius nubinhibens (strain ATCC BAA-591 / DSM 15170 / ISM) TaxID=89187 RepID=A3SMS0_ROSNI|nr:hypothetical protein ISM_12880 [Roseovarius nubinhibens ISM]